MKNIENCDIPSGWSCGDRHQSNTIRHTHTRRHASQCLAWKSNTKLGTHDGRLLRVSVREAEGSVSLYIQITYSQQGKYIVSSNASVLFITSLFSSMTVVEAVAVKLVTPSSARRPSTSTMTGPPESPCVGDKRPWSATKAALGGGTVLTTQMCRRSLPWVQKWCCVMYLGNHALHVSQDIPSRFSTFSTLLFVPAKGSRTTLVIAPPSDLHPGSLWRHAEAPGRQADGAYSVRELNRALQSAIETCRDDSARLHHHLATLLPRHHAQVHRHSGRPHLPALPPVLVNVQSCLNPLSTMTRFHIHCTYYLEEKVISE
ncbi:hypothetical protein E2C01_018555 [Portunus trituberculatus]|uniref:Uncharacterized protein n=1 Tax=Portunus trituberculatus TaxID=210409 RepID=A0A5B7DUT5_PORTR|nr:hypothetical protein [Portunus trituberculatus]